MRKRKPQLVNRPDYITRLTDKLIERNPALVPLSPKKAEQVQSLKQPGEQAPVR
jgi:hypothetical protein